MGQMRVLKVEPCECISLTQQICRPRSMINAQRHMQKQTKRAPCIRMHRGLPSSTHCMPDRSKEKESSIHASCSPCIIEPMHHGALTKRV